MKLKLNSFLFVFSLEKGAQMIGTNDVITLLVEVVLAILSMQTVFFRRYFRLPVDKDHAWLLAAQLLLVDLLRVLAFGYLLKSEKAAKKPRLIMLLTRVCTMIIHITLLSYAFYIFGVKGYILVVLANILLFTIDVYFCLALFSYYL